MLDCPPAKRRTRRQRTFPAGWHVPLGSLIAKICAPLVATPRPLNVMRLALGVGVTSILGVGLFGVSLNEPARCVVFSGSLVSIVQFSPASVTDAARLLLIASLRASVNTACKDSPVLRTRLLAVYSTPQVSAEIDKMPTMTTTIIISTSEKPVWCLCCDERQLCLLDDMASYRTTLPSRPAVKLTNPKRLASLLSSAHQSD